MINSRFRTFLFLSVACLLCFPSLLFAQQKLDSSAFPQNEVLSMRYHIGFVIAHHPYLQNLVTGHTQGIEIALMKQADGSKPWHNHYLLPQTGFVYIHLDLANPDVLGNADGLMYAMNFPLGYHSQSFQTSLRLGCGLGWISKKFDRIENYRQITIGSHLNAAIQINAESKINFSQRLSGNFVIGLTHFSNGAFTYPNLGINNASAGIGLCYSLTPLKKETNHIPASSPPDKKIHFDLLLAAGSHAVDVTYQTTYFSSTLSFAALKQVSAIRLLGLGADIFYDPGLKRIMERDSVAFSGSTDNIRSGIYFDHEQVVGKTSIIFQVGIYTINPYRKDGMIYNRLGFKYRFHEKYFANLTLKAHLTKANYVEWGVGKRF